MNITLEKFEGPLALLLKLIESEELDITTISLAKIADDYIGYIKANADIDPEEIADFLVVAARLLLIKSRALLPYLYPAVDDDVDDLERQIKMYKEYLLAAKEIEKLASVSRRMYPREIIKQSWLDRPTTFTPPNGITVDNLRMICEDLVARLLPMEKLESGTVVDHINIEDKIEDIKRILSRKLNFYFSRFMAEAKSKTEVIVGFLAVLELMKQRDVLIEQLELFGEIEVKTR